MTLLLILWLISPAAAHDWSSPHFVMDTPQQQEWLKKQKRPGTHMMCCNEADGAQVDEEIRYDEKGIGHYWIWSSHTRGRWMQVPDEAIIREPNMHGRPVAWFRWIGPNGQNNLRDTRNLEPTIFCYSPGPLL